MKEEGSEEQIQVAKGKGQAGKERKRSPQSTRYPGGRVTPPHSFGAKVSRVLTPLLGKETGNSDFYM